MDYQQAFDLAQSNTYLGRIQEAMFEWVLNLQALPADAPLRAAKVSFALQLIQQRTTWVERLQWFVTVAMRRGSLPEAFTDEQLQACVDGLIDLFVAAMAPPVVPGN